MTKRNRNKALNKQPYWDNEMVQFPRLLAEIYAVLDPVNFNDDHNHTLKMSFGELEDSMGLNAAQIRELLERADKRWEGIKSRSCPGEPCECGCHLVPGVLFPCHAGDSGLASVEACSMCNRYGFDDEAGSALHEMLMKKGYTLAPYLLPGMKWEDAGAVHLVLMRVYTDLSTERQRLEPQTVEQGEDLCRRLAHERSHITQPTPECCPACGKTALVVQLPAAFLWDGKAAGLGPEDLVSDEFQIEDQAVVVCNGCDWTGKVSELADKE